MNFTEQELSLMDDYIKNNLTEDRRILFDESMKKQNFKDEVVLQLSILSAIQSSNNDKLKKDILSFEKEYTAPTADKLSNKEKSTSRGYIKYLAALLLLVALSIVLFWVFNKGNEVDQLYADMYETYPANEIQRGKIDQQDITFTAAMDSYRKGEYQKALGEFQALESNDQSIDLYVAVCHMELEQFTSAQSALDKLKSSTDLELKQAGEWYQALILFKTNKVEEFNLALQNIVDDNSHLFNRKAKELKSKL